MFRIIALFFLLFSLSTVNAQAQAPGVSEDEFMFTVMEEVIRGPLTQKDVDVFIKAVNASKKLKESNLAKWQEIEALPLAEKRDAIAKAAGLASQEDFFVSSMRIQLTRELKTEASKEDIKLQLQQLNQQAALMESQLASLPPDQQKMFKEQMALTTKMLEYMLAYPDSAMRVYEKNKTKIEEAIAYLESE